MRSRDEESLAVEIVKAEAARYRAALQEIERVAFRVTEGPDPDGDLVTYCQWCRMADRGRVQHRDWCAVTIAHRALHPEGEEG